MKTRRPLAPDRHDEFITLPRGGDVGLFPKLEPKLLALLHEEHSRKQLIGELAGSILVGIIALPRAIATAIAVDVAPEQGALLSRGEQAS